jgi:hypothetical protein
MGHSQNPYAAVIADLAKWRDEINAAIDMMTRLGDKRAGGAVGLVGGGADIPPDAFFGLTIPEAAKKYLAIVHRPQSLQEIADGLLKGGMVTTAKDFPATIHAIFRRNAEGEIIRVGDNWALAEWYNKKPRVRKPGRKAKPASPGGGRRRGKPTTGATKAPDAKLEVVKPGKPRTVKVATPQEKSMADERVA